MYYSFFFLFNDPATAEIYTLSLHDALPISAGGHSLGAHWTIEAGWAAHRSVRRRTALPGTRSEEHTSELQSLTNLVCRLLLEKKKVDPPIYGPRPEGTPQPPEQA